MARRRSPSVSSTDENDKPVRVVQPIDPLADLFLPTPSRKTASRPALPFPRKEQPPQLNVDDFWRNFASKTPGKIHSVLPADYLQKRLIQRPDADEGVQNAVHSYEEAARMCKEKVEKIVKECRRVNQKYRDPHFDIETDFYERIKPNFLHGLIESKYDNGSKKLEPKSVKRIADIFTNPSFFTTDATATDVRQGRSGDCWLMSAICTACECPPLIERICVARNEEVGVYGFVFSRDGAWISEVVDDKLYLTKEDYCDHDGKMDDWLHLQDSKDIEREYKKRFQTGSKALYFGQCTDQNATWLPLLEKAFAKAHGDYLAIEGGFVGEAIEDLTGGVTSEVSGSDILDKDRFWRDELMQVNKKFLFGCGGSRGLKDQRNGILNRHAYSIMEAREIDGKRLVKLRNPWGNTEWEGPWSDGSEEWTPYWMEKLNHKFGNDGVFWISYEDLLHSYQLFDRTRLFDETWSVTQKWISLDVPWAVDYHDTYFDITVSQAGPVVIVLSQLDDRYFRGLEGQYDFKLQFRLHEGGEADYLVRSPSSYDMCRSVSTEVDLEPGTYSVMVKITATHWSYKMTPEEVVLGASRCSMDKLQTIGMSYDLAHSKVDFKADEQRKRDIATQKRRAERKTTERAAFERRRKGWGKSADVERRTEERLSAARKAVAAQNKRPVGRKREKHRRAPDEARSHQVVQSTVDPVLPRPAETLPMRGPPGQPFAPVGEAFTVQALDPQEAVTPLASCSATQPLDQKRVAMPRQESSTTSRLAGESSEQALHTNHSQDINPPLAPLLPPPPPPSLHKTSPVDMDFDPLLDSTPVPEPRRGIDPRVQAELSWDSDLDAFWDTGDERFDVTFFDVPPPPPKHKSSSGSSSRRKEKDREDEPGSPDAWNAVCVVGLRVYGLVGNEIGIRVVRPEGEVTVEKEKGKEKKEKEKRTSTPVESVDESEESSGSDG